MDLGWWAAHAFEVAGIGLVGIPAALDLRHSTASRPLVGDLRAADLVADEEAFLGGRVHALMRAAGREGRLDRGPHAPRRDARRRRSASSSACPADRLRLLALGGLLHDMGKLAVPGRDPQQARQADRRGVRVIRGHPGRGPRAADRARRLPAARARPRREPPRAPRRRRLPEPRRPARSTSRSASSPSPTSTTRSPPTACTARRGRPSARSRCSTRTPAARSTQPASPRCARSSRPSRTRRLARVARRGRRRRAASWRPSGRLDCCSRLAPGLFRPRLRMPTGVCDVHCAPTSTPDPARPFRPPGDACARCADGVRAAGRRRVRPPDPLRTASAGSTTPSPWACRGSA